jgi:hypothetical protein
VGERDLAVEGRVVGRDVVGGLRPNLLVNSTVPLSPFLCATWTMAFWVATPRSQTTAFSFRPPPRSSCSA